MPDDVKIPSGTLEDLIGTKTSQLESYTDEQLREYFAPIFILEPAVDDKPEESEGGDEATENDGQKDGNRTKPNAKTKKKSKRAQEQEEIKALLMSIERDIAEHQAKKAAATNLNTQPSNTHGPDNNTGHSNSSNSA